ncbi:uncharacterized protein LOC141914047 isoform X2 [Tubulanus polymorphus]
MAMTQSRIPLPAQVNPTPGRYQYGRKRSDPSNASALQATFQQKLMKEKEQKLIDMYEDNQKRALDKVNRTTRSQPNSGSHQRRTESTSKHSPIQPDPDRYSAHDRNKKRRQIPRRIPTQNHPKHAGSAGRDRSNLLQPIQRNNHRTEKVNERYEEHVPTPPMQFKPKLVRARKQKDQTRAAYDRERFENMNSSDEDNLTSAALEHIRRQQHSRHQKQKSPTHLSDFEKWQIEQDIERQVRIERAHLPRSRENSGHFQQWQKERDIERENRIIKARVHKPQYSSTQNSDPPSRHKHKPPKPKPIVPKIHFKNDEVDDDSDELQNTAPESPDENDWEAEIKRKEQELIAKIKQQQAELERMKLEREKQEEKDKAEEEKEMKRKAAENKRKKLLQEMQEWNDDSGEDDDEIHWKKDYVEEQQPTRTKKIEPKTRPRVKKWEPPPTSDDEENVAVHDEPASRFYEEAALASDAAAPEVNVNLKPCSICGRKFALERLEKHKQACSKASKKRKVFDATKMRTVGTEAQKYNRDEPKQNTDIQRRKKVNWRAQHEDFIKSIRYAKKLSQVEAAGGKISDLPPPPPSENPDYVQCPYCERRFNPTTAERHIPKCKDIKARPAPPKKGVSRRR